MTFFIHLCACIGLIALTNGCQTSSSGQVNLIQTAATLKTENQMLDAFGTPKSCARLDNGNRLYTYFFNMGKGMGVKAKYCGIPLLDVENRQRAADIVAFVVDPHGTVVSYQILSDQTQTLRYRFLPF